MRDFGEIMEELEYEEVIDEICMKYNFNRCFLFLYWEAMLDKSTHREIAQSMGVHVSTLDSYRDRLKRVWSRSPEEFLMLRTYVHKKIQRRDANW